MGKALAADGYRKKVFLMTKNCGRDYKMSTKCLEDSLRRLQTDHLDLWQFHEINYDNDPDWIFERGAIKAAMEARKAGKVRFIGFTGHKDPRIHLKMLGQAFEWDTVQCRSTWSTLTTAASRTRCCRCSPSGRSGSSASRASGARSGP